MFNRNGDLEHKPGKRDDAEKAPEHGAGFDLGKTLKQAGDAIGRVQNDMIERVTNVQVQKQYVASISPALASQYARGREIVLSRSEAGKSTSDLSDLSASELKAAQTYQRLHSDLPSKIPFYNKETLANDLDRDIVRKARSQPQPVAEVRVSERAVPKAEARQERAESKPVSKVETKQENRHSAKPELAMAKPESKSVTTAHNDVVKTANLKEQRQTETRNEPKASASNSVDRLSDKHSDRPSGKPVERIANQANISESPKTSPGNALLTSLGKNKDDSSVKHESNKPETTRPVPVELAPNSPSIRAEALKISTIVTPSSQMVAPNIRLIDASQSQIVHAYRDGGISVVRQLSDRVACAVIRVDVTSPKIALISDSKPSHDSVSTSSSSSSSKPIYSSSLGAKFVSESKLDTKPESKLDPKPDLRSDHKSESKPDRNDVAKNYPVIPHQEIQSPTQKNSNLDSNSRQTNISEAGKAEKRGDENNSALTIKPEIGNNSNPHKKLDLKPDLKPDAKPSSKVDAKFVIAPPSKSESKTIPARSENRQDNKPESKPVPKAESKSDLKADFRPDVRSEVRPSSVSQDKNIAPGYRLRSQEENHKYLTGPEIALSAIIALASISKLRTDQSMWQTDSVALVQNYSNQSFASQDFVMDNRDVVGKNDVASATDTISSEHKDHGVPKKAVFIRPKILIGPNDSLVSIAEQLFNDAGIAWLILKLNIELQPLIIEGKTVVRLRSRQEIIIPVYQDILDFQKIRTKEMAGSNLITVVEENQIDREIVDLAIAPMLGHKSSNTDPLQPLQIVPDENN